MTDLKRRGRNVTIFPEAQIVYPENVSVGDESMIDGHCFLYAAGEGIEIGRFCHVTGGSHLQSGGLLKFEDFSACGPRCIIMAASDNYQGEGFIGLKVFGDTFRKMDFRPVTLRRHAHVGAGTIILPGVTIGEGCSVGAGSIVTRDLPPWTVCVGSPARPVKTKPCEKQLAMEREFLAAYEERRRSCAVSVCCLTYNHEAFIAQALDGFLMQETDFPFEVIVHDDASTDRTPEIVREYAARHPGVIRPVFQTENRFRTTGRYPVCEAYTEASGRYIAECDGDDYWTDPHKLQRQVDYLDAHPGCIMTHHAYRIAQNGRMLDPPGEPRDFTADELVGFEIAGYGIATSTKMYRNIYTPERRREFDEFAGDYPLNVLLGMHGGTCAFLPDIAPSVYRKHAGNSWSGLSTGEQERRTKEMHRRLYELALERGNPRHIAIRKEFI